MATWRLHENHPTAKKLEQLTALALDLGITLNFYGDVCEVEDVDVPDVRFKLEDIEESGRVTSFPHGTETKLTYEKK